MHEGAVTELGIPMGSGGRDTVVAWLAGMTQAGHRVLWVNGHVDLQIFPPAWFARGIDSTHIWFADSQHPLADLHTLIGRLFFKVIVFDTAHSHQLPTKACAYLASYARRNSLAILVIRNHFVSNRLGNPFAKFRANVGWDTRRQSGHLQSIRGQFP